MNSPVKTRTVWKGSEADTSYVGMSRGVRPRIPAPRSVQGTPVHIQLRYLESMSIQLRAFTPASGVASRTERLGRAGEGFGTFQMQLSQFANNLRTPPDVGLARMQNPNVERLYQQLVEFASVIAVIEDRMDRGFYVSRLGRILDEQEERAAGVLRAAASAPYPKVIISQELARLVPGVSGTSLSRATPDRWSERPWFWESRFWSTAYNQEQVRLRQEQAALTATGVRVPQPWLVSREGELQALKTWFQARAICTPSDPHGYYSFTR